MRKIISLIVIGLTINPCFAGGYEYLTPTNTTNRNFSTIMQHKFEKEETLDFINNSEDYAKKREAKEKYLDYQAGKVDIPKNVNYQYRPTNGPGANNLQFVKDENGKIRIQGIH